MLNGNGKCKVQSHPQFHMSFCLELHYPHDLIVEEIMKLVGFLLFVFFLWFATVVVMFVDVALISSFTICRVRKAERQRLRHIMDREPTTTSASALLDDNVWPGRGANSPPSSSLDARARFRGQGVPPPRRPQSSCGLRPLFGGLPWSSVCSHVFCF